jgi:lysozyme
VKIADGGLKIIKTWEQGPKGGAALEAYQCDAGVWTIGYGHTKGVKQGDTCSIHDAYNWLREDCQGAEDAVHDLVVQPINQNQFDALVSFVFNLGRMAFANSTLLKMLNAGDYPGAARQFPRWNRVKGKIARGLVARRRDEVELFETPV